MTSENMNIGLLAPHTGYSAGPESLAAFARTAEELGFHSLWVGDHIVLPANQASKYPYRSKGAEDDYEVPSDRPFLESLTTLGFLAGLTSRCYLGVSVAIIPYRPAALWAKSVGTLVSLTSGRFILGVGVGWLAEEFAALGVDISSRGSYTDETLALLRKAWNANGPLTSKSSSHVIDQMYVNPGTGMRPAPEVWVGGNGEPALRRTAKYGDVWHPHIRGCSPQDVAKGLSEVRRYAGSDRPGVDFRAALHVPLRFGSLGSNTEPWADGYIQGSSHDVRVVLDEYRAHGVTSVVLSFGGGVARRKERMHDLASELIE